MKCFHFSIGEKRSSSSSDGIFSRSSTRASWPRSVSASFDTRHRPEFDSSNNFRDLSDVVSQRRSNNLRVFNFSELKSATNGFNRALVIGEGGFGCVYRGIVSGDADCSLDVAIKQLSRNGFQASPPFPGHKEWINEVNILGVVNHPNLVKLIGYCAEDDERGIQRLLVYELMKNKSLEDHLLGRVGSPLSWMTRLQIAQGAARGLAYLHEEMNFQLIFRDFKTSNILLDEEFKPKLSDFGLARQGPAAGLGHVSTAADPKPEPELMPKPEPKLMPKTKPEPESESGFVREEGEASQKEIVTRKQGVSNNYTKRVFDFKELRNRSIGRFDWRHWSPGMIEHSVR
ncbi:hypothetical protein E3N88_31948 [Mikania micrantha]|uniref:non-specific serine/threonine protein kinase n=1 Tax=Mikania micrantha TaxID=192012 RepID=A0A5N6M721_9ASTR|nr:hypothetical protein E3N88_31948 [Mikania micrantha]